MLEKKMSKTKTNETTTKVKFCKAKFQKWTNLKRFKLQINLIIILVVHIIYCYVLFLLFLNTQVNF